MKSPRFFLRLTAAFAMVVLLIVALPQEVTSVSAATIEEQIDALEREQKNLQQQIASAKGEMANSKRTRDLYNKQIDNVQNQIDLLDNQISAFNRQIAEKNNKIAALEKDIADNRQQEKEARALLGKRLNALVRRGNLSTLQMLMDMENYTEYLLKSKLMECIAQRDQEAIDALEEQLQMIARTEQAVQNEKVQIESQKNKIQSLRNISDSKKRELDKLCAAANKAYIRDKAEVESLDKELQQTENNIKKLLASLNSSGSYNQTSMYWPVPTVRAISSVFGSRWGTFHKGVDIANGPIPIYGENIVAAADGTVIYANNSNSWGGGYGYYCMVDHGRDAKGRQIVTLYAHCSKMFAYVGQKVIGGKTVLAQAGKSGNVTGPHLHFEVRVDTVPTDPLKGYISVNGK